MSTTLVSVNGNDTESFEIAIPDKQLLDMRRRLAQTRWPEPATVADWSQGVPLPDLQAICGYWRSEYDWRATERRLNRWPQYVIEIDGLTTHYFHLRSTNPSAAPLILTHGWPGSFFEFEQAMERLADPSSGSSFHLVVPSLPGYGFSGKPASPGWGVHRIARAWAELMQRLGYQRFIAAGSELIERDETGSCYSAMQGIRPQTIGYSLLDSPAGLCAWILEKLWSWADHAGDLYEVLSQDQVLDNITLYWLSGSGASAARLYWESIGEISSWFTNSVKDSIDVPTGCTIFPREVPRPSRRLAERRFTNIVHWGEPARGGHFGAWEQPELFVDEVRAVRRSLTA